RLREMLIEPGDGELDDAIHRARLFEEVRGARHDYEPCGRDDALEGLPVELYDHVVVAADDQERRGGEPLQRVPRKVGATAARDYGLHLAGALGRRLDGRRRAGARTEKAERERRQGG